MIIKKNSLLILALSFSIILNISASESEEKDKQLRQTILPYPILIVGGAIAATSVWKSSKLAVRITIACLSNPIIGVGTGVFVVSPVLARTLFALNPETDMKKLREEIKQEWKIDMEHAQTNINRWYEQCNTKYEQVLKDFEQKRPMLHAKIKTVIEDEQTQKTIKTARKKCSELNQWRKEKQNQLADWLKK